MKNIYSREFFLIDYRSPSDIVLFLLGFGEVHKCTKSDGPCHLVEELTRFSPHRGTRHNDQKDCGGGNIGVRGSNVNEVASNSSSSLKSYRKSASFFRSSRTTIPILHQQCRRALHSFLPQSSARFIRDTPFCRFCLTSNRRSQPTTQCTAIPIQY